MAERVQVRELMPDEGNKLLGVIRRGSGSVVRWRRAQVVLWSAQAMDVPAIAKIAFTSGDRVRGVIHNFNSDGFDSLAPKYAGGRPPKFTRPERQQIKKIALARPITGCRSRRGRCRSWRSSWWLRGWSTTSATRAFGACSARKACRFK